MTRVNSLLLLFISSVLNATSLIAQPPVGITHVTVVDMASSTPLRNVTVLIVGDRISKIGRNVRLPQDTRVIEAKGKFLIPGLWDMHVHALSPDRVKTFLQLLVANGVTGIRDMGTTEKGFAMLPQLRSDIASEKMIGPRIIAAGRIMDGAKPSVPSNSIPFSGEAAAREQVRFLKRSGADFIKVYDGVSRSEYFAIIDEAKNLKIPVAGHVPAEITSFDASNAGQRSFEHLGNILRSCSTLDPKAIVERANVELQPGISGMAAIPARIAARTKIELETFDSRTCSSLYATFVKNQTWQVPTLATKRPLSLFDDGGFTADPRMKYIAAKELENWKPENNFFLKFRTPEFIIQKKNLYRKELELVSDMHRAGVPFMAGTDIPGAYTYPGFSLHDELELFVDNGFTPFEALQTATINPARFLGLERDLGTVEVGKLADLVLLDANPLSDIKNTRRINAVFVNGRLFIRDDLDKMLDEVQAEAGKK